MYPTAADIVDGVTPRQALQQRLPKLAGGCYWRVRTDPLPTVSFPLRLDLMSPHDDVLLTVTVAADVDEIVAHAVRIVVQGMRSLTADDYTGTYKTATDS